MVEPTGKAPKPQILIVSGPSGAGRSTAINVLEDLGFEAIDNMPLQLLPALLEQNLERPLALGIDVRNRNFSTDRVLDCLSLLETRGLTSSLLFLDAAPDVLLRRFSETRRRHPLKPFGTPMQGIDEEIELLKPLYKAADFVVDTSTLSPHDLRAELQQWFGDDETSKMAITIHSFSYKRGAPRGLDTMIDCRFLANPHWVEELKPLTGLDQRVQAYVQNDPVFATFFKQLNRLSHTLIPRYVEEGKTHLSIGFGCTGGQHRSVTVAELLAKALADTGWQVSIRHREIERR